MTRRELLETLNKRGVPLQPYQLEYLVSCGQVPPTTTNARGQRVYAEAHVQAILGIERFRRVAN